jgi:GWxTD domain-containing protein
MRITSGTGMSLLLALLVATAPAQDKAQRAEMGKNSYYYKWLNEDVYWIISEEERDVFTKLQTDEERDAFIEQFWARRDPDPDTPENEFKIEHYRRIVYANETYSAGISGWKSDRGMIYIKFGPPDRFESQPAGGTYTRERKEGGGVTSVFPFERWEYRHIDGIGDDVELEFVDDKGGGLYELTWDKQRKDALLLSGLMGLTDDELEQLQMTGNTNKQDRISGRRYSGDLPGVYRAAGGFESVKDKPFAQLDTSAGLNRPPLIKFKDLETVVSTRVTYGGLPFDVRQDFVRITDQQVMVPLTVLVSNEQMSFKQSEGFYHGKLQIYGRVVSLRNRIEAIFEDEVARDFLPEEFDSAKPRSSIYQKRLILKPGLYRLEVAVKDVESKRIGTVERRLEVPKYGEGQLTLSSLILADRIEAGSQDRSSTSFILGDLKVIPKTDDVFRKSGNLGLYVQVYNFAVDQQSQRPALKMEYGIAPKGGEPEIWRDVSQLVQYAGLYCRLARMVNLSQLKPGDYTLHIRVKDSISSQNTAAQAPFTVIN